VSLERLGAAARLSPELASRIVAEAKPHASALLAREELDVVARQVPPQNARGGSLIPAWPLRNASGGVTIEYVADWGALLAGWLSCLQPAEREMVDLRQRVWIGIANDVLQLFVIDPPAGRYSMVRHHALMLAAATLWLGPSAARNWQLAHERAARGFLERCAIDGLWTAVDAAERGLDGLLANTRCRQPVGDVLAWLDSDSAARAAYTSFLGAASLGVAAALAAFVDSRLSAHDWLQQALVLHARRDFNRDWMERLAQAAVAR
jgi:hypothetical protein